MSAVTSEPVIALKSAPVALNRRLGESPGCGTLGRWDRLAPPSAIVTLLGFLGIWLFVSYELLTPERRFLLRRPGRGRGRDPSTSDSFAEILAG